MVHFFLEVCTNTLTRSKETKLNVKEQSGLLISMSSLRRSYHAGGHIVSKCSVNTHLSVMVLRGGGEHVPHINFKIVLISI